MDFTRKTRYVAGGNLTDLPENVPTYILVVSRKLVRILFLIYVIYDMEVHAEEIINAFLNAQCTEKVCFKAGPKFRSHKGLWVIIVRALYVLKSARALFKAHLVNTLQTMGFKMKSTDCTVWMRNKLLPLTQ